MSTSIVSISEMARLVGLSRARFYQLIGTTFPYPVYDIATRRPFYDEELQRICLDVRRRNCGIDGKPLMFYSRLPLIAPMPKRRTTKPSPKKKNDDKTAGLVEGLKSLGLNFGPADVEGSIKFAFPDGVRSITPGELLRGVFLHLKRKDSGDNVGRY